MKLDKKRSTTRRRSQTHRTGKPSRGSGAYATIPLQKMARIAWPALGVQRSAALFASACLALVLLALLMMPEYAISSIVIKGNQGTATQDLESAVSFVQGRNAFMVRSRDIVKAVMALSGVEKVQAHISLPGRLEIVVKDTKPEILWLTNSQSLWLDAQGVVRDQPATQPELKLTIKDVSGKVYGKGDRIDKAALAGAQKLSVLMPRDIQSLEYQREGELTVIGVPGWRALFNTREDLEPQITALRRTLATVPGAVYLDVRAPSVVGYR